MYLQAFNDEYLKFYVVFSNKDGRTADYVDDFCSNCRLWNSLTPQGFIHFDNLR
jgi:hypothetical protein